MTTEKISAAISLSESASSSDVPSLFSKQNLEVFCEHRLKSSDHTLSQSVMDCAPEFSSVGKDRNSKYRGKTYSGLTSQKDMIDLDTSAAKNTHFETNISTMGIKIAPNTEKGESAIESEHERGPLHEQVCSAGGVASPKTKKCSFSTLPISARRTAMETEGASGHHKDPSSVMAKKKPRLTLSAFRRPEQTVRLTDADPKRLLASEYDLCPTTSSKSSILGHGTFSTVRLAVRRSDGMKVAVKCIAKHEALRSRRLRLIHSRRHLDEWEILRCLDTVPSIVSLFDLFETDNEVQMVLEYCPGGELFDAIQRKRLRAASKIITKPYSEQDPSIIIRHTEAQAAVITFQLLQALAELHTLGIVHRDIKCENVLLVSSEEDETRVKLSDFGLARVLHRHQDDSSGSSSSDEGDASPFTPPSVRRSRAYSRVGSDYYVAPEVCAGDGYDTSADIYSLGVTLYILLCGFPPSLVQGVASASLGTDDDDDLYIVDFPLANWSGISEEAKTVIRRMLCSDPERRISAEEALKNPWIARFCMTKTKLGTSAILKRPLEKSSLMMSPPRLSSLRALMPPTPTSTRLEFVRNKLHTNVGRNARRNRRGESPAQGNKKRKALYSESVDSSTDDDLDLPPPPPFITASMAEALYRGVVSAAASVTAVVAGICDDRDDDILLVDDQLSDTVNVSDNVSGRSSPFSAIKVLSV
eukprot:CAMPEP_0198283434 /NCGR_PEP_ID=MMETSP1449-20131203/3012_1 /TAXON_ID=420275 /ORGANISM="Attheya septentrionalis, Strain CCMP2084" /LENGTH=699 /DNA_ID=CAMNT_0043980019 /DNA_START=155 /DNA_END=2254 /DNA_ORIENTATION=-